MSKLNEFQELNRRLWLYERTLAEMVDMERANELQKKLHAQPEKTIAGFNTTYQRYKRHYPLPSKETEMLALFNNIDSGLAFKQLVYNTNGEPIDYLFFDVNPQFEKILHLDRESVVGQLASEIYLSTPIPYLNYYIQAVQEKKTVYFKTYYRPTNKQLFISVIPLQGKRFAALFQDLQNFS